MIMEMVLLLDIVGEDSQGVEDLIRGILANLSELHRCGPLP